MLLPIKGMPLSVLSSVSITWALSWAVRSEVWVEATVVGRSSFIILFNSPTSGPVVSMVLAMVSTVVSRAPMVSTELFRDSLVMVRPWEVVSSVWLKAVRVSCRPLVALGWICQMKTRPAMLKISPPIAAMISRTATILLRILVIGEAPVLEKGMGDPVSGIRYQVRASALACINFTTAWGLSN